MGDTLSERPIERTCTLLKGNYMENYPKEVRQLVKGWADRDKGIDAIGRWEPCLLGVSMAHYERLSEIRR